MEKGIRVLKTDNYSGEDETERKVKYPWIADFALYLHLPMMILLYAAYAWRIMQGFSEPTMAMTILAYAGCVISATFIGAVPNVPISHELWHRKGRFQRMLGYTSNIFMGDPNRDLAIYILTTFMWEHRKILILPIGVNQSSRLCSGQHGVLSKRASGLKKSFKGKEVARFGLGVVVLPKRLY